MTGCGEGRRTNWRGEATWNGTKENSSLCRRVARRWMECFLTPQLISAKQSPIHHDQKQKCQRQEVNGRRHYRQCAKPIPCRVCRNEILRSDGPSGCFEEREKELRVGFRTIEIARFRKATALYSRHPNYKGAAPVSVGVKRRLQKKCSISKCHTAIHPSSGWRMQEQLLVPLDERFLQVAAKHHQQLWCATVHDGVLTMVSGAPTSHFICFHVSNSAMHQKQR